MKLAASTDAQVQELVDQIRDLTRRGLLTPTAPSPGAPSPAEPLPGAVRGPLSGGTSPPRGGEASQEREGLSPASVPATVRKRVIIRTNRIRRPNVVTRRAAAELTGAVTRYRGVCPNNNNNNNNNNDNYAVLAERFQPSTLHKLRQVGLYTNTDTPDSAHQLDAEAVAAEVAYTRTDTKSSCSGGEEPNRVPNTFKEAICLPQATRWKAVMDKEMTSLEKNGVFDLVLITSVPVGHKIVGTRWMFKRKAGSTYKGQLVVQGVSQILGMNVTREYEKGTITISKNTTRRTWYSTAA